MSSSAYHTELHNIWAQSVEQPDDDPRNRLLEFVLLKSTHKTYKYILVNGLLGAAAQWNNPLVLQAQSSLERPWDARSVCHKVLVPFEREQMEGRLGSSNEPFLNKPARFPELSDTNAVRRGKDKQVLDTLIDLFTSISDQDDARKLLRNALHYVRMIPIQKIEIATAAGGSNLVVGLKKLLEHNIEGEVLTFCVGLILWSQLDRNKFLLSFHPTNQSGASSKEIADIDVSSKKNGAPVAGFEVKDKHFNAYDFEHAQQKAFSQGASTFTFVSRAAFIREFAKSDHQKFSVYQGSILPVEALLKSFSYTALNLSPDDVDDYSKAFLSSVRPKEETVALLKAVLAEP